MHRGVNLTNVATIQEALELLKQEAEKTPLKQNVYAYGWSEECWGALPGQSLLDEAFTERAVIAINLMKSYCWMNKLAQDKYQFLLTNAARNHAPVSFMT